MTAPAHEPAPAEGEQDWLRLALPRTVLERLLRERTLAASELRSLDPASHDAARRALLRSLAGAR